MSPNRKHPEARLWQRLLLSLIALALAVPMVEIMVRIAAPQTLTSQEHIRTFSLKHMYVTDERAGYRFAPHFSGTIERNGVTTTFSTNSLGLRGEELGPKQRIRILALGDSMTWGWGVSQGEEWIMVAARGLNRRLGEDRVEGVNAGVNGYGSENEYALLERLGPLVMPDLVICGFFANDYVETFLGARGRFSIREGHLFDEFYHRQFREHLLHRHSHLWRHASTAWGSLRERFGAVPDNPLLQDLDPERFQRGAELSADFLVAMRDVAGELGARFAVLWIPSHFHALAPRNPDISIRDYVQGRVVAAGIPSIDLMPFIRQRRDAHALFIPQDGHLTALGQRLAGEVVADWILRKGLLPLEPTSPGGSDPRHGMGSRPAGETPSGPKRSR